MTALNIFDLIFDVGLLVLIWLIQLVVYPSFAFYSDENLINWHAHYTNRISIIVMPLMLGQLFLTFGQLFFVGLEWLTVISCILVVLLWMYTFRRFVPLHSQISVGLADKGTAKNLVTYNWWRTALWTILPILDLFYFI
jgi:hypothetical protein